MKLSEKFKARLTGITEAFARYYMVFIILAGLTILFEVSIHKKITDFSKYTLSLFVAALAFLIAHTLAERFAKSKTVKIVFLVGALILSVLYFSYIYNLETVGTIAQIRTTTLVFVLISSFVLVPSLKGGTDFNAVFLSVFKAFFISVFFSGVIYGGVIAVVSAINALDLWRFNYNNVFRHITNITWIFIAPTILLSLIPIYGEDGEEENEKLKKAVGYPKFLQVLLSYVLVPISAAFTIVVLAYILKTITTNTWDDNLLEPMLLSYLISILPIYLLVKRIDNATARIFTKFLPLCISLIAAFQLVASFREMASFGIVIPRYYIIIFGIYSFVIGIWLFLGSKRKNGYVAALAIAFAIVCSLPYVGAFDVSMRSQANLVRTTLIKNDMLSGNKVIPKSDIPNESKEKIIKGLQYIYSIEDRNIKLEFLPSKFDFYNDLSDVFGFSTYNKDNDNNDEYESKYRRFNLDESLPIDIAGYDYFAQYSYYGSTFANEGDYIAEVIKNGKTYILKAYEKGENIYLGLFSFDNGKETLLIEVLVNEISNTILSNPERDNYDMDPKKLTFDSENSLAKIRIRFQNIVFYDDNSTPNSANMTILFGIK